MRCSKVPSSYSWIRVSHYNWHLWTHAAIQPAGVRHAHCCCCCCCRAQELLRRDSRALFSLTESGQQTHCWLFFLGGWIVLLSKDRGGHRQLRSSWFLFIPLAPLSRSRRPVLLHGREIRPRRATAGGKRTCCGAPGAGACAEEPHLDGEDHAGHRGHAQILRHRQGM